MSFFNRIFFAFGICFTGIFIQTGIGQITVNEFDFPDAGDTIPIANLAGVLLDPLSTTGANVTWHYGDLSTVSIDTDSFVSVTSTPVTYQFFFNNIFLYPDHKADYAKKEDSPPDFGQGITVSDFYTYYKKNSVHLAAVGFGASISGAPVSQRYLPIDTVYTFPMSYTDTYSGFSSFYLPIPGYGLYGRETYRSYEVDGYGILETPYDTMSVIRVRTRLEITDTIWIDSISFGTTISRPDEYVYDWIANGVGMPLLTIKTSDLLGVETVSSMKCRYVYPPTDTSSNNIDINEILSDKITIYPNPVMDKLSIDLNDLNSISCVTIMDSKGNTVYIAEDVSSLSEPIAFHNFANGIYQISFYSGKHLLKTETIIKVPASR